MDVISKPKRRYIPPLVGDKLAEAPKLVKLPPMKVAYNTPINTVRDTIKTILTAKFTGISVTISSYMSVDGVKSPCIIIQHIGSREQPWGGGEWQTGTVKAIFLIVRLQIDVWANDENTRDSWSDKIIEGLWEAKATLKSTYHIYDIRMIETRDMNPTEPYAKIYRKSLRYELVTEMTNA